MNKSKLDNFELMNKETGEIVENTKEIAESVLKEDFKNRKIKAKYLLENKVEELSSEEINEYVKLLKLGSSAITNYEDFTNYYTGNKDKLIIALNTLSDQAFKCFYKLVTMYSSCENTIQAKNHKNIVKDVLFSEKLNISESKWRRVKKELIKNNCIRRITFNEEQMYKINPTIIGHKMKITKETYYAFRNQLIKEFSKLKMVYWDKILIEAYGYDILEKSKTIS